MGLYPTWTVHCDGGDDGCHGWAGQEDSRALARAFARARGWLVPPGSRRDAVLLDYCPSCRKLRGL